MPAFGARLPIISHVARVESRKFAPRQCSQGRQDVSSKPPALANSRGLPPSEPPIGRLVCAPNEWSVDEDVDRTASMIRHASRMPSECMPRADAPKGEHLADLDDDIGTKVAGLVAERLV